MKNIALILFGIIISSCSNCTEKNHIVKSHYEKIISDGNKYVLTIESYKNQKTILSSFFLRTYNFNNKFSGKRILDDIIFYNKYFNLQMHSDSIQNISILLGKKEDLILIAEQRDSLSYEFLNNLSSIDKKLNIKFQEILKQIDSKL